MSSLLFFMLRFSFSFAFVFSSLLFFTLLSFLPRCQCAHRCMLKKEKKRKERKRKKRYLTAIYSTNGRQKLSRSLGRCHPVDIACKSANDMAGVSVLRDGTYPKSWVVSSLSHKVRTYTHPTIITNFKQKPHA